MIGMMFMATFKKQHIINKNALLKNSIDDAIMLKNNGSDKGIINIWIIDTQLCISVDICGQLCK